MRSKNRNLVMVPARTKLLPRKPVYANVGIARAQVRGCDVVPVRTHGQRIVFLDLASPTHDTRHRIRDLESRTASAYSRERASTPQDLV